MNAFYQAIVTQDPGYGNEGTIKEHFNRVVSSLYGTNRTLPVDQFTVDYLTHPKIRGKGYTQLYGMKEAVDYLAKIQKHANDSGIGVTVDVLNGMVYVA